MGSPKARVLPDPVAAMPIRSWPESMIGQHWAWMGDGWEKVLVHSSTSLSKPHWEKAVTGLRSAPSTAICLWLRILEISSLLMLLTSGWTLYSALMIGFEVLARLWSPTSAIPAEVRAARSGAASSPSSSSPPLSLFLFFSFLSCGDVVGRRTVSDKTVFRTLPKVGPSPFSPSSPSCPSSPSWLWAPPRPVRKAEGTRIEFCTRALRGDEGNCRQLSPPRWIPHRSSPSACAFSPNR